MNEKNINKRESRLNRIQQHAEQIKEIQFVKDIIAEAQSAEDFLSNELLLRVNEAIPEIKDTIGLAVYCYENKIEMPETLKEAANIMYFEEYKEKIQAISPKIQNVIDLANACLENGIDIPMDEVVPIYKYNILDFEKDESGNDPRYKYLECRSNADPSRSFLTDGNEMLLKTIYPDEEKVEPLTYYVNEMSNFINRFKNFEKDFLKWVDGLRRSNVKTPYPDKRVKRNLGEEISK